MKNALKPIVSHLLLFILLYIGGYALGGVNSVPTNTNLVTWDAEWYQSIKDRGYTFKPGQMCNLAFFPLFPYAWKYLMLSPVLMSIANYLIFLTSLVFLVKSLKPTKDTLLFILAIPSFIFFAVPYSEAIFFLFGTLIIMGYRKSKTWLLCLGFLGASLVRSVSLIFIPAIILTELAPWIANRNDKLNIRQLFLSICASLTGLGITIYVQYAQTGKWIYFLTVQKFWNRHWVWPKIPFTTYSPQRMLGLDGVGVGIVVITSVTLAYFISHIIFKRSGKEKIKWPDKEIFFSTLFIMATGFMDITFTFYVNSLTNIWSINRHLLCSPFTIVFLLYISTGVTLNNQMYFLLFASVIATLFLTGLYQYTDQMIYYMVFFIFLFTPRLATNTQAYRYVFCLSSIFIQVVLYNEFLQRQWIG